MKVLVFPADEYGCGHHRLIWPSEVLRHDGHDVTYVPQRNRKVKMGFDANNRLQWMDVPDGTDVVVFQRITDRRLVQVAPYLRGRGIAVVIDVDDDLAAVHPAHPGFMALNPRRAELEVQQGIQAGIVKTREQAAFVQKQLEHKYTHSWRNLEDACQQATLVTVSTDGLLKRYARHGRGRVVRNYAPDHYLDVEHVDSSVIGWPAAIHSHPNDPTVVGNAVRRLVDEGETFVTIGDPVGAGAAFGLTADPPGGNVEIDEWPHALTKLGIGMACLADTLFNSRKSWLKPLELSAVGVPWVASPRAEYVKFHALGAGVLVDKPKQWYRALRDLVNDPVRRVELSLAGREVARSLRLSDHAWRHLEAWTDAVTLQRGSRSN